MEANRKGTLRTLKAQVLGENAALRGLRDNTEKSARQLAARLRSLESMVGSADETAEERGSRIEMLISRGILSADFSREDYEAAMQQLQDEMQEVSGELHRLAESLEALNEAVLASDEHTMARVAKLTALIEQIAHAADERALLDMVIEFKQQHRPENDKTNLLLEARDLLTKKALSLQPADGSAKVQQSLERLTAQISRLNANIAEYIGEMPQDALWVDERL
jgi:chromosome segregation ATPase